MQPSTALSRSTADHYLLLRLRDQSLEAAAANVVVGHGMSKQLLVRGVEAGNLSQSFTTGPTMTRLHLWIMGITR
jgi:hypothetical protein